MLDLNSDRCHSLKDRFNQNPRRMKMRISPMIFAALLFSYQVGATEITYSVNGIKKATELGPIETDIKSIKTGDHHCDRDCKGEPTRTSYRIDYSVNVNEYVITDAKLSCDAGASCSFNQVRAVNHTNNTAYGAFDVWSRESTWTLTVQRRKILNVDGETVQIDSDQLKTGKSFVVEHDTALYRDVELEANMPFGVILMNPKNPSNKYFELLGESKFGTKIKYTLLFKGI
jgi:hypothetical protein